MKIWNLLIWKISDFEFTFVKDFSIKFGLKSFDMASLGLINDQKSKEEAKNVIIWILKIFGNFFLDFY